MLCPTEIRPSRPLAGRIAAALLAAILLSACAAEAPSESEETVETYMVGDIEVRTDGISSRDAAYRTDEITFELAAGEGIEYKYRIEEGETMLYSWSSSGPVRIEMHAEADGQAEGTAEFFEVVESGQTGHGSYTAPFPGIHGWWWLNLSEDDAVTVTLHSSGFYGNATEFREGNRRMYQPGAVGDTE